MAEDAQDNFSAYLGLLVASEFNRRKGEKEKRGPGRPRKDDDEENPYGDMTPEEIDKYENDRCLPHPDLIRSIQGEKVTQRELDDWNELKKRCTDPA